MAIVLLTMAMSLSFFSSCKKDVKDMVEYVFNPETSYTTRQKNVVMLISDSGVTRTKATAETWLMFDKAADPYWFLPDGIYIERLDSAFSIKADTAYRYIRRDLWELKGNVEMLNMEGQFFETSQVFWDEQKSIIYSEVFIRITKGDDINTGIGFTANQDLSEWEIREAGGEFYVETKRPVTGSDSIPQDTLNIEN